MGRSGDAESGLNYKFMRYVIFSIVLVLLDVGVIWWIIQQIDLHPSMGIGVLVLLLTVFGFNLLVAYFLYLFSYPRLAKLFAWNSVFASIIMWYLFQIAFQGYTDGRYETWVFRKDNTKFTLTIHHEEGLFYISRSLARDMSQGSDYGEFTKEKGYWVLTTPAKTMTISGDQLIGFESENDTIQLKKVR